MRNEDFHRPYTKSSVSEGRAVVLGIIISGLVYGLTLWTTLWFIRSSGIASWQMPFWKCVLLTDLINALRLYDQQVFSKKQ